MCLFKSQKLFCCFSLHLSDQSLHASSVDQTEAIEKFKKSTFNCADALSDVEIHFWDIRSEKYDVIYSKCHASYAS